MDINTARKVTEIRAIQCPNCYSLFKVARRCPECGQLVENNSQTLRNLEERARMVKAMEFICRQINDEEVFEGWLMNGVADGDINDGTTISEIIDMGYCDDDTFVDLMDCFLRRMKSAYKSGGLYCGEAVSTIGEEIE